MANTPAADYLAGTERDADEQWRYKPIKKRRRKEEDTIMQGLLL